VFSKQNKFTIAIGAATILLIAGTGLWAILRDRVSIVPSTHVEVVLNEDGTIGEVLEPGWHIVNPDEKRQAFPTGNLYNVYSSSNGVPTGSGEPMSDSEQTTRWMPLVSNDGQYTLGVNLTTSISLEDAIAYINEHIAANENLQIQVERGFPDSLERMALQAAMAEAQEGIDMSAMTYDAYTFAEALPEDANWSACEGYAITTDKILEVVELYEESLRSVIAFHDFVITDFETLSVRSDDGTRSITVGCNFSFLTY